jgi:phosphoribosylaminoimidazole-succinocarboxamide synthase
MLSPNKPQAAEYALTESIIIADTKFEFGVDENGTPHLIDEVLTPDKSRFWPLATYKVGASPESFDEQFIRNWLDSINFNRKPSAPEVRADIAQKTSRKYREALTRLTI